MLRVAEWEFDNDKYFNFTSSSSVNRSYIHVQKLLRVCLVALLLMTLSLEIVAGPLDDATALVFEWLDPPAPRSEWPAFDAALSNVIETASASRAANESLEFAKDQLDYYRKQQAAGALEESELWEHAKQLVHARQINEAKLLEYVQALHAFSKRWGSERWWEMRDMLVAYTGWHPEGCDTSAVVCD